MKGRYEIKDSHHPNWRGQRFTVHYRAQRELAQAVGAPGRWLLFDRKTKEVLETK